MLLGLGLGSGLGLLDWDSACLGAIGLVGLGLVGGLVAWGLGLGLVLGLLDWDSACLGAWFGGLGFGLMVCGLWFELSTKKEEVQ